MVLYHGSHRWTGNAEVRPLRAGHAEAGPGIYFTTRYTTAAKYARGGGRVWRFTLADDLRWADRVDLQLDDVLAFLARVPRLKKRRELQDDVRRVAARRSGVLTADVLINLFVNYDQSSGASGVALAEWLVERGVDAAHERQSGGEEWVVLLNPRLALRREPVDPDGKIEWDLEKIRA